MGSEIVERERDYGNALASTTGDSPHAQVMRDAAASIFYLCDYATALEAMCEKMAGALEKIERLPVFPVSAAKAIARETLAQYREAANGR